MSPKTINRIKVVLVEKNMISKQLAEQLGANEAIISRWLTNNVQPNLATFFKIAELLYISRSELIIK